MELKEGAMSKEYLNKPISWLSVPSLSSQSLWLLQPTNYGFAG